MPRSTQPVISCLTVKRSRLSSAQVVVVGTNIGTITNVEGAYTLRDVPAGTVSVRALSIGYTEQTRQVAVESGGTATADFALRATAISMDPRVDLLFRERAFWLFSRGYRVGDLRRLVRQYGRAANTIFPTGEWHKGGQYGTDVTIPLPFEEANNPNIRDEANLCLDRIA